MASQIQERYLLPNPGTETMADKGAVALLALRPGEAATVVTPLPSSLDSLLVR
jgi:hypothetical protein